MGLFHQLPSELTDSLIVTAKRQSKTTRRAFNDALTAQAASREEKQKALCNKKLDVVEEEFIGALYML